MEYETEEDDDEFENESFLEYLLRIGAIEPAGESSDGETLYRVAEAAKERHPALWEAHETEFNNCIFALWQKDYLDIEFDEDGDAILELQEVALNPETYYNLEKNEIAVLKDIIRSEKESGEDEEKS